MALASGYREGVSDVAISGMRRVLMPTTDTRPPLYLTASEAKNWFSLHSDDIGRDIVIVAWKPAEIPEDQRGKPPRVALGHNAVGTWVWADEAEGQWPYGAH